MSTQPSPPLKPPPLKIAMVAPPWYEVPPDAYGGIELVVGYLVDQLVARGHDVTLLASGHARTSATRFVRVFDEPPTERLGQALPEVLHAATVRALLEDVDVDLVHDHTVAGPLLAGGRRVPTVVTMHGPVGSEHGDIVARLGSTVSVVAISDAQRRDRPELNWAGTVHNAIDVATYPFGERGGDYVLWVGRFTPDKGPELAIDAARAAGWPIVLAGKCNEPEEFEFFDEAIKPRLGDEVTYVGEADAATKRELYTGARALVFPIRWDEPFGMVMIEALASGTPIIATRRGSVPEIVDDGVTGLVLDPAADVSDVADALAQVGDLDRRACRRAAEERFDLHVLGTGYEQVYRSLVRTRSG